MAFFVPDEQCLGIVWRNIELRRFNFIMSGFLLSFPHDSYLEAIFLGMPMPKKGGRKVAEKPADKIINIRDIQHDVIVPAMQLATINVPPTMERRRFQVQPDDVLITSRSTLKIASVRDEHAGALAVANLIVVRPGSVLDASLVLAFLQHSDTRQVLERERTGTTVTSINIKAVANLELRIPTIEQQVKLAGLAYASERAYKALTQAADIRRQIAQEVLIRAMEVQ